MRVLYLPESVLEAWEAAEPSYFIKKQNTMNKLMNDQCGPYALDKKATEEPTRKYGIICLKDGDPHLSIPIMDKDDDSCMATWNSLEEAKDFAAEHILCQISAVIYIDLENGTLEF